MDSANSGSMQSSSGGDDQEFDSRGESSLSSFLNPFGSSSSSMSHPPSFLAHQQNPIFFDPSHLSHNNLHHPTTQYTNNDPNNNDLIWSRGLRSDQHNYTSNFANLSSSSPSRPQQSNIPSTTAQVVPFQGGPSSSSPAEEGRAPPQSKNPKKRTRASRRAPTTVLTTDTANFRQMVQEFTGIPAAPFSGSPYSRRLDLFSAASAFRSGGGGHLDSLYSLRPSPHKIMSSSPFSPPHPSSLLNSAMIDNNNNNNNPMNTTTAAAANNPNNFPLSSGDHRLLNLQSSDLIANASSSSSSMDFSNLSGFLSRETTHSAATGQLVRMSNDDNLRRWRSSGGGTVMSNDDGVEENMVMGFDGNNNINSNSDSQQQQRQQHMGISGGYNLNLAEKGMENNAGSSAPQGTVSSWICPSD